MSPRLSGVFGFIAGLAVAAATAVYVVKVDAVKQPRLKAEYHAVLLDNGQAYFGRLENSGDGYFTFSDVFYVQSRINSETKETTNILVKRGKEVHEPSYMILNASAIQYIEPVGKDSQIARLIAEANNKP